MPITQTSVVEADIAPAAVTEGGRLAKARFGWLGAFVSYSGAQAVAQAIGFVSGILVVRSLPKEDYGWYMIANTIGPIMLLLSDVGVSSSLNAIGGRVWHDDRSMGSLVRTAMGLRKGFIWVSCGVVVPILVGLLVHNKAPLLIVAVLTLITCIGVYFQINVGVLNVVISLRQQVLRMQKFVFIGSAPRLVGLALLAAAGWLNAGVAALMATAAIGLQMIALNGWVKDQVDWTAPVREDYRKEILSIVKKQAPLTIYFCIQAQLGTWLISVFGDVERVADVGALGRFATIFSVLMSAFLAVVIPRFSRCHDARRLRKQYRWIVLSFMACVAGATVFAAMLPGPMILLLGPKYAHLRDLVWIMVLGAGITNFGGVLYYLNINRGWIPPASILIPAEIITQIVLCCVLKISTVKGVLWIGVFGPIVPGLINFIFGLRKMSNFNPDQAQGSTA